MDFKDRVAVIGIGTTAYGAFPETDAYGLGADALNRALADCGLTADQIDGLIVNRMPSYYRFGEMMGINPRWGLQLPAEGRQSGVSLVEACLAVVTGQADYVALVYGNNGRSVRDRYGGGASLDACYGMTSPGAIHAMMFRRHMHQYGTTSAQLAAIPVAFRKHAGLNDAAVMRKPITVEEHQASRFIVEPLHIFDYCLINDGAVALIVTSAERARDLPRPPVYVSGWGRQDVYTNSSYPPRNYWYGEIRAACERAYGMAGIDRSAMDAAMIYDNFSPTVLFSLEGAGFCGRGEGGEWIQNGRIELGGELPVNTSGGHLSESYMQGWGLLAEAVRQLRGDGGARQVPSAETVQYIAATNIALSIIFRR